ncbi:hypothetical protein [Agromyces sp. SYSU T00266]|uniref:hypothetical protein n=1 Tax=Agromyces zhanjiangensis TaxID=3158562 RepID=UPI0033958E92
MEMPETEVSNGGPQSTSAKSSLIVGIIGVAAYTIANPLIVALPLSLLGLDFETELFVRLVVPVLLCLAAAVLGIIAIVGGKSALLSPDRARAGAGLAFGVVAVSQPIVYLLSVLVNFAS